MSRNGSGGYSLPEPPFVTGTVIDPSPMNDNFNDIAQALTGSVAADGQTPMTGNLDLNSHAILNGTTGSFSGAVTAANGTGGTQVVNYSQFNPTLGTNGYTKMPGGLLRQWGYATTDGSGSVGVTWPAAFSGTPYNVQCSVVIPSAIGVNPWVAQVIASPTSTGGSFATYNTLTNLYQPTIGIYWEAWGPA